MKRRLILICSLVLTALSLTVGGVLIYTGMRSESLYASLMPPIKTVVATEYHGKGPALLFSSRVAELREKNSDCVATVYIPDTPLDYPVMRTEEEDGLFYFRRNFYKERDLAGVPFLDARCRLEDAPRNLIIYGHAMKNGKMFEAIGGYTDRTFWGKHPYIYLETASELRRYEVVTAIVTDSVDENALLWLDFVNGTDEEAKAAIEALAKCGTELTRPFGERDNFLTLVKCDYSIKNGRMLVVARQAFNT